MKRKKPEYLDYLIEKQQRPHSFLTSTKDKVYQIVENNESLSTLCIKLTEFSYKISEYFPKIF